MSKPPFLDLPPGARAVTLDTERGAFAVHRAGSGERGTALLVPGFTGSKEDFIALLGPLAARGFAVVAVDGRGQYETPGPERDEAPYRQGELAEDLLAQARALDGRVHVVGHSLGGLVSRAAVLRDPAPFASLTLLSSGPAAVAEDQRERVTMLVGALEAMDMESVWQAMRALDPPEAAQDGTPPEIGDFLHRRWLGTAPAQLIATGRQLVGEPDRVDALAEVGLPTHVLSGERDYAWPVEWLDAMALRLGARRTVVAGAEHSPNVDDPAVTAGALADFWGSASA
ncbi:2-succinyl-6-hydroxy-2,4-cyclohexadiene-1-carboxylate synthase [Streptomyces sp. RB5]|uniref:2-succinyl-6-hydroxy-2, 4-cyclohexadiene-1-carboxylate synthase n=1 Tax=Streptomyces smaragdinus TaxID=2585196 RepID=A0A7K0CVM0_9ACTN|nr:alpha/beta hydrolase [Streptomyces smaragdinus]MQY16714.1 2-succinyl-6-hydroxy-2,4-cyclohexadiene-1-carboxylate synthase [Streptomyces smaragdinus]